MKQIQPISTWDSGQNKQGHILHAFGTDVKFGTSAEFYYTISNETEQLASGKLTLEGDDYQQWDSDTFAWDWIAKKLNLAIIRDYVKPEPIVVEELAEESEPIEPDTNTTQ
jgi:hypothetical protein